MSIAGRQARKGCSSFFSFYLDGLIIRMTGLLKNGTMALWFIKRLVLQL
jgi:hypothetical protein